MCIYGGCGQVCGVSYAVVCGVCYVVVCGISFAVDCGVSSTVYAGVLLSMCMRVSVGDGRGDVGRCSIAVVYLHCGWVGLDLVCVQCIVGQIHCSRYITRLVVLLSTLHGVRCSGFGGSVRSVFVRSVLCGRVCCMVYGRVCCMVYGKCVAVS
jgi:hypothetical protein